MRWPIMQAAIVAPALVLAWGRQRELKLPVVLGLGLAFELGWIVIHLAHGVDAAALGLQALVVAGGLLIATRARNDLLSGVAIAAMAPVVFLLFNRVFSPQFLVVMTAAWAFAGSLVVRDAREQFLLGLLVLSATLANTLVYPTQARFWAAFSLMLFVFAIVATLLVYRAAMKPRPGARFARGDVGRWEQSFPD